MPRPKRPAPTTTQPDENVVPIVKKKRARRLPPEVIAAMEALEKAKAASAGYAREQKMKRLLALQASLNDRLDALEAEINRLQEPQ